MVSKDYSVRGRSFRTASDYQAALRDQQKIQTVEKKYGMLDRAGRENLIGIIQQGRLKFETLLGNDFLEELEERFQ